MPRRGGGAGTAGAGVAAGASDAVRDFTYHERQFLKALDYECVRFLVVGSWASGFHGLVLDPADLDVLIGTDPGNAQAFLRQLAADLVLLAANPINNIQNTKKINAVIINGRFLDRAALDHMLAQAEVSAKAQK